MPRRSGLLALLLLTGSCVRQAERERAAPLPRIDQLFPTKVIAGQTFNPQSNGHSALGVKGAFFGKGARLLLDGHPLATSLTDANTISALVTPDLLPKAGTYAITVDLPDGRRSNTLPFIVLPASGPGPVITKLFPDQTPAGQGFNLQPDGQSAIGLAGMNFLPGAQMLLNGTPQETNFSDLDALSAFFDQKFFQRSGRVQVTVRNPDGKESPPVPFTVH